MKNLKEKLKQIFDCQYTNISGLNEGEKYFLPSLLSQKSVVIVNSFDDIEKYQSQLESLNKRVVTLSSPIPLVISRGEKSLAQLKNYCVSLSKIVQNDFDVLLMTSESLFQKLPKKDFLKNSVLSFERGCDYKIEEISKKLVSMGYSLQEIVSEKGDFSVRGDIVDIFPINLEKPIRLNFFDTELEKINFFDLLKFNQEDEFEKISVFCCSFIDKNKINVENVRSKVQKDLESLKLEPENMIRISSIVSTQFDYLENNLSGVSSVFFLPYFDYFGSSIFDYLSDDIVFFIDEPKLIFDKIKTFEDENVENFLNLSLQGEFLPKTMEFYLKKREILKDILNFRLVAFSRLISQNKIFSSEQSLNFICQQNLKYQNHFVELTNDCLDYKKNKWTVVISCGVPLTLNKVKNFFDEANLNYHEIKDFDELKEGEINITLQNIPYSFNFEMEKLNLIGSLLLNGNQIFAITNQSKDDSKPKFLPKVGEYVVHQIHGVGKCVGIENLKITSVPRDYIVVEYKDNDILYVPSENADLLSSYNCGGEPKCNKIGGAEFYKVKQKVKNSIKEMAFDLVKVYSDRLNSKGFKYSKDSYLQQEFENAFPYPYTDDQIQAIRDIKNDMESSKIMDRLLCGDVGFGKTEVAFVAAFKAIQDGKQVAIICPTTILCEQHFNTALSRMKDFMVNVEAINRFKTKSEQDEILKKLKDGKIDLICGTHRLFSQDVKFKNLGLIILDEEQRFGVEDKERLKNLKRTVDVLSMSATPIPRTLYMSLVGIRDVSFLSTPPKERKKITTAVIDYSDNLLVNACNKELERGGQVLIVYNKVETITNFYAKVKSLLPNVEIGFAHGQMNAKTLEKAIYDLYSRKTQILISTILIENGIDLPYANTLFVMDSDKLGLSQLYQLRGRIGRSNLEAFAFFSFERNKVLTSDSYKRLDAIMEFSDFGSGYKIAMRDLEIRGAGDILGKLQHGHMQQVGYDLYVKLLNEAVSEIKGEKIEEYKEVKLNIAIPAYLPNGFMDGSENRISFYTKVSKIETQKDFDELLLQTQNKFGNLPKSVRQLCLVGFIKNLAEKVDVKNILLDEFSCKVTFYNDILNSPLYDFLSTPRVDYVLSCEKLPIITLKKDSTIEKMQDNLIKFLLNCLQIKNK